MEDVGVVDNLEGLDLVVQKVFGNLICYGLEVDDFDGHFDPVADVMTCVIELVPRYTVPVDPLPRTSLREKTKFEICR